MVEENLAQILRRSASEPELFADFYRRLFDRILAYLARRTFDQEVALDLAAESFAQAYIDRSRFRGAVPEQAEAWIYRIAQRQLARYQRRGELERKAIRQLGIEVPLLTAESRAEIEELAELERVRQVLTSELMRLSSAQRQAVTMRVVDELPYADIASKLDITEQAARLRVSRGLRAIAASLEATSKLKELSA